VGRSTQGASDHVSDRGLGAPEQEVAVEKTNGASANDPPSQLVIDSRRDGQPSLSWTPTGNPRRMYEVGKRSLDLFLAVLMGLVLSPVLIAIAVIIRITSPGPVFFRQERVGRYANSFCLLKYRTMRAGADESHHRQHAEQLANGNGKLLLMEDDPRVTPIGRFLRKSSLDELPNLWNVIKGEMSLVGPRPLVPYELMLHDREYLRRLEVMPGITGLAQVKGRLNITMDERGDRDLDYVDRCSFWYDMRLLLRTIPVMFTQPGA
jgi:lipopolysaccharide/colanic/teichoic acid biosynthesis glycosyltransferase